MTLRSFQINPSIAIRVFAIGDDVPGRAGHNHRQFERRSHARLIKAGEEAIAEKWLQMRIDVHFFVLGILVKVQTRTIVHISVLKLELNRVLRGEQESVTAKLDPMLHKRDLISANVVPIDLEIRDFLPLKVEKEWLSMGWPVIESEADADNPTVAGLICVAKVENHPV